MSSEFLILLLLSSFLPFFLLFFLSLSLSFLTLVFVSAQSPSRSWSLEHPEYVVWNSSRGCRLTARSGSNGSSHSLWTSCGGRGRNEEECQGLSPCTSCVHRLGKPRARSASLNTHILLSSPSTPSSSSPLNRFLS